MAKNSASGDKFKKVLVMEVEMAKDKNKDTEGGKYRKDTPWLRDAFAKKGYESDIIFITNADTAESLCEKYPNTAFLGRVNPMDYDCLSSEEYLKILDDLIKKGVLLGPTPQQMMQLGSKTMLYEIRGLALSVADVRFHKLQDMKDHKEEQMDLILPKGSAPRVLKVAFGSTGFGVWKCENKEGDEDMIIMTDAYDQSVKNIARKDLLTEFLSISKEDAISMPFLPLIKDGEVRFLMSKFKILEIVHKKPMDESAFTATLRSGAKYTILDLEEHKIMVESVEKASKEMLQRLKIAEPPYWWSMDFIEQEGFEEGQCPSFNAGKRLVLSEINCSCLGLVADTSEEAKKKGMQFADMIANIVLP